MQYPTRIRDIAINAIGLSGIQSECRRRRVRISPRDRLRRMYTRSFLSVERGTALSFVQQHRARNTRTHTPTRIQCAQIFNFFLGINSRRTNIFPSVITSHGKCYRKWDWSKNAIFRVAWLFTFVLLTNTPYATVHLKNIGTTILRFNLIIKWKGDRNSKSSYYLIFLLLFNTAEYNYFVLKQH